MCSISDYYVGYCDVCIIAEIVMLEGTTCVYRSNVDLYFYVVGSQIENEVCAIYSWTCLSIIFMKTKRSSTVALLIGSHNRILDLVKYTIMISTNIVMSTNMLKLYIGAPDYFTMNLLVVDLLGIHGYRDLSLHSLAVAFAIHQ